MVKVIIKFCIHYSLAKQFFSTVLLVGRHTIARALTLTSVRNFSIDDSKDLLKYTAERWKWRKIEKRKKSSSQQILNPCSLDHEAARSTIVLKPLGYDK